MGKKELKTLHDKMLATKPTDASHNTDSCLLCAELIDNTEESSYDKPEGGSMSDDAKTYTQDELQAAVDKAIKEATVELQAKLNDRDKSVQEAAIQTAVANAETESNAKIQELQSELDKAVLEASKEKSVREELEASIAAEKAAAEKAAEVEAKKVERIESAKEFASLFTDEYITENASRWAEMSDDDFSKSVDEWKVIASRSDATKIPSQTAMTASRNEGGTTKSALSSLRELRHDIVGKSL